MWQVTRSEISCRRIAPGESAVVHVRWHRLVRKQCGGCGGCAGRCRNAGGLCTLYIPGQPFVTATMLCFLPSGSAGYLILVFANKFLGRSYLLEEAFASAVLL